MRLISKLMSDFLRDESGATAIEYALIAIGISIVIVATVTASEAPSGADLSRWIIR